MIFNRRYAFRYFTIAVVLCITVMSTSTTATHWYDHSRMLHTYNKGMTQITTKHLSVWNQQQPYILLRGGGSGNSGGGIRFAPPIVHSSSKTAPPTTTTTSTATEVKEQIDAFLTRDSRNTFIGTYSNDVMLNAKRWRC